MIEFIKEMKKDADARLKAVHSLGCSIPSNTDYALKTLMSAYDNEPNELVQEEIIWAIGSIIEDNRQKKAVQFLFNQLDAPSSSVQQRAKRALLALFKDDSYWFNYVTGLYEKAAKNIVLEENFESILKEIGE